MSSAQTIDRYAVMGNPIAHSKSPVIHQLFAEQTQQQLSYEAILVDADHFNQAVTDFAASGGRGLNITVPFKQDAWQLATLRSERAERAGAVNTLSWINAQWQGDNTDGVGLLRDLTQNNNIDIKDKRLLVLGAGGAVRGVLAPLLAEQPESIIIANRTVTKAETLTELFSDSGNVQASSYEDLSGSFDLVINGTAASLQGGLPPVPEHCIALATDCYDMMYAAEPTPFMSWATQLGANKCMDGLGMLVEQAAESFFIWRQVRPDTQPVINAVRDIILSV